VNVLLTGGTGFFGLALLKYMAVNTSPCEVTVLSRNPDAFLTEYPQWSAIPWLTFHAGDVTEVNSLDALKGSGRFTHLLHAATDSTHFAGLNALMRMDQIIAGTRNMLQFATEQHIRRFLLTSSGAVYGAQPADMATLGETYLGAPDPLMPENTYGLAKRMAEHLCAVAAGAGSVQTVVARCFAFVGPDLPFDAHFAIGNFIRDALYKPTIDVKGDGSPIRSYMHQSDLAHWLLMLLMHGRNGHAYNVGSDQSMSIATVANLVRDVLAPTKPVVLRGVPDSHNQQRNLYVPDITKAKETLGLQIKVQIKDAIWLSANRL